MQKHELEAWVLDIADRVRANQLVEDDRVQLKAKWPHDLWGAARRIAGHANAARGDPILWIIGIDEKASTVCGANAIELADWIAGVRSHFGDGVSPDLLMDLAIRTDGESVVALYFATDRAPYLVKNPDGGKIGFEVPWHNGTAIRTARRGDLLRLLTPVSNLPKISVLEMKVDFAYPHNEA